MTNTLPRYARRHGVASFRQRWARLVTLHLPPPLRRQPRLHCLPFGRRTVNQASCSVSREAPLNPCRRCRRSPAHRRSHVRSHASTTAMSLEDSCVQQRKMWSRAYTLSNLTTTSRCESPGLPSGPYLGTALSAFQAHTQRRITRSVPAIQSVGASPRRAQ